MNEVRTALGSQLTINMPGLPSPFTALGDPGAVYQILSLGKLRRQKVTKIKSLHMKRISK